MEIVAIFLIPRFSDKDITTFSSSFESTARFTYSLSNPKEEIVKVNIERANNIFILFLS